MPIVTIESMCPEVGLPEKVEFAPKFPLFPLIHNLYAKDTQNNSGQDCFKFVGCFALKRGANVRVGIKGQ
jgi:hypothetical protein